MSGTYLTAEARARRDIDAALEAAGWAVQNDNDRNLGASRGAAVREMALQPGRGKADCILYVDFGAIGAVEAKKWAAR